jgi:hypothetical protein
LNPLPEAEMTGICAKLTAGVDVKQTSADCDARVAVGRRIKFLDATHDLCKALDPYSGSA